MPFQAGQVPSSNHCRMAEALPSDDEVADRITDTELQRLANLCGYSVVRKYRLHNLHLQHDAVMTVRLNYPKGQGKSFEIIGLDTAERIEGSEGERRIQS